jgi:hypothetical protein
MKVNKGLLFFMSGAWVIFFLIEKVTGAAGTIHSQGKMWPLRVSYLLLRIFKSALTFCLVALNVFMAITLLDSKRDSCR